MNRKGFTLIELLIVVVIIGILAAIAIPKFANTKEKAYIASMKSDLKNLVTAQEAYFADSTKYATSTTATGFNYNSSAGVTVKIGTASGTGWNATATHPGTKVTCAIFAGDQSYAVAPATKEGEPACQ